MTIESSLGATCGSPVVFLAFAVRETLAPERSGGEQGGSHAAKASETRDDYPIIKDYISKRS